MKNSTYQKYMLNVIGLYRQRQDVKAYLEILLSIVTIAIFVLLAIKPTLTTIGDLISKINSQQLTSDQLDTKIKNIGIAQTNFNANQSSIDLLDSAVPNGPDVINFTRQIETLAHQNNVSILNMAVDSAAIKTATSSGNTPQNAQVHLNLSGNYASIKSFLSGLETLLRPSISSKFDMTISSGSTLYLTITLSTPFIQ